MTTANRSTVLQANGTATILSGIGNVSGAPCEGVLHTVTIAATTAAGSVLIYDNTSATGNPVAALGVSANQGLAPILDIQLQKGLTATLAGFSSPSVTFTYR